MTSNLQLTATEQLKTSSVELLEFYREQKLVPRVLLSAEAPF